MQECKDCFFFRPVRRSGNGLVRTAKCLHRDCFDQVPYISEYGLACSRTVRKYNYLDFNLEGKCPRFVRVEHLRAPIFPGIGWLRWLTKDVMHIVETDSTKEGS